MNIFNVPVLELSDDKVSPYGKLISIDPNQPTDIYGENWRCWYPMGSLQLDYDQEIGMVMATPGEKIFNKMEKHPNRSEWVFALESPYIQAFAKSDPETPDLPDPNTVKAFLVKPGQSILISKDIWHAPGIATGTTPTFYGFVLGKAKEIDERIELGLVPFQDNISVKCN